MVSQVKDQPVTSLSPQTGKTQKSGQDKSAGFDELLQQKRTASDEASQAQDRQPVQKKDEAPKAEGSEETRPQAAEDEKEIPDDAKAVLAAMMLQPQLEMAEAEVPKAAVETSVEALAAEHAPVAEAAMAEAAPVAQTAEQSVEVKAPVEREVPVEAEAQPQQELQQAEVVERAPETVEMQPRRNETHSREDVTVHTDAPEKAEEDQQPDEAPVFAPETAEAMPVKVAEPVLNAERPVPIESEQAPQDLAEVIMTGMENGSEISVIRIAPENLGPVQLTLTRNADGTLHMALEAANPKTVTLLEKHAANVQNIMANNLHEEVRVEVKENEKPHQQDWTDERGQQRQQERRQKEQAGDDGGHDFLQRLRLGLIGPEDDEE